MSSHHSIKFFITHYGQEVAATRRRQIKQEKRELEREENALKWAAYRHQRAVLKAQAQWLYIEVGIYLWVLITIASIVLYGLRNI